MEVGHASGAEDLDDAGLDGGDGVVERLGGGGADGEEEEEENCKLQIANCKLGIEAPTPRAARRVRVNSQFAICNLQFAI
jgi:hypothetical protein